MSALDLVFEVLESSGCEPKWSRDRRTIAARVPGREDRNPSLSVWASGAWVNLKDLAGIRSEAQILDALGVKKHQLGPETGKQARSVAEQLEQEYVYRNAEGEECYRVVRFEPKAFKQCRMVDGKRIWNLRGVEPMLYRLPELIAAGLDVPIYVGEGEKDVDALVREGCVATCNSGGAGKFRPEFAQHFEGRNVIIVADKDEAGLNHARQVIGLLEEVANSVRVVEAKSGKDASDHLETGHSVSEFVEVSKGRLTASIEHLDKPKVGYRLERIGDMMAQPPEEHSWLVEGLLAMSGTSMIGAKPKVGKSTFLRYLAFCVSRGIPFLGLETLWGPVIYLAIEEKTAEVVKRFREMGCTDEDEIHVHTGMTPLEAIESLIPEIERIKPVLIVVDPLFKWVKVPDTSDYAKVSNALEQVTELARKTGAHVALAHHLGKGDREDGDSVLGSTAIFGAVDTLLVLRKSSEHRTVRSTNRYGEDLEEQVINLNKETCEVTLGGTLESFKECELLVAITDLLKDETNLTESEIRQKVKGNSGFIGRVLRGGLGDRFVRTGNGTRSSPYLYSLVPDCSFSSFTNMEKRENEKTNIVDVVV